MTREEILSRYEDTVFLFMDGYDDCVVGVVERFGMEPIICYDR